MERVVVGNWSWSHSGRPPINRHHLWGFPIPIHVVPAVVVIPIGSNILGSRSIDNSHGFSASAVGLEC